MATYQLPFTGDTIKSELQQLVNNEFTNVMSQTSSPAPLADNDEIPTTGWVQDEISSHNRDHAALINRDADNQHPISAITGLGDRLNGIDSDIETINGEIDGFETSKQDKLTAGTLVDITNNTISIGITSITNSEIDVMFE